MGFDMRQADELSQVASCLFFLGRHLSAKQLNTSPRTSALDSTPKIAKPETTHQHRTCVTGAYHRCLQNLLHKWLFCCFRSVVLILRNGRNTSPRTSALNSTSKRSFVTLLIRTSEYFRRRPHIITKWFTKKFEF